MTKSDWIISLLLIVFLFFLNLVVFWIIGRENLAGSHLIAPPQKRKKPSRKQIIVLALFFPLLILAGLLLGSEGLACFSFFHVAFLFYSWQNITSRNYGKWNFYLRKFVCFYLTLFLGLIYLTYLISKVFL